MKTHTKKDKEKTHNKKRKTRFNLKTNQQSVTKEPFQPELTILGMSLKDAEKEVNEKQLKLSVALEKMLAKDINKINQCLYLTRNKSYKNNKVNDEDLQIINNIITINKQIETMALSKAMRIVAVRRVLSNKGFRSPGISDEKKPTTNEEYAEIVEWLRKTMKNPNKYEAGPLDRIYLKKPHTEVDFKKVEKPTTRKGDTFIKTKGLRPISIPSIKDRCLQAVYLNTYGVYAEHVADEESYGFRPGKSTGWVAHSIETHLRNFFSPQWALEIDISKCFDSINHKFIINHTPFIPENILYKWLKQGYILRNYESLGIFPTDAGIPQGGVISPTICNTVLDGMTKYIYEEMIKRISNHDININKTGYKRLRLKSQKSKIFKLFRYADDIVVLTKSKYIAEKCKEIISEFLKPRGLELSIEKTKLTDISGGKATFNFVGYCFIKKPYRNENKWLIIPPEKNIRSIQKRLKTICDIRFSIAKLFFKFNEVLRSWCNYYYTCNARKTFKMLNQWVYKIFYKALTKRIIDQELHIIRNKNRKNRRPTISNKKIRNRILQKYLTPVYYRKSRILWFTIKSSKFRKERFVLFCPQIFKLGKDYPLSKSNLNFFNKEDRKIITIINLNYQFGIRQRVMKANQSKFNGICACESCASTLYKSRYEFHHKLPIEFGGITSVTNLILLCNLCHKEITKSVLSRNLNDCIDLINQDLLKIPKKELEKFTT